MALYTSNNRRLNSVLHSSKGGTYATGTLTLFVVVAMILFAILPAFNSINEKLASNKQKQQYLSDLTAKRTTMDSLLEEFQSREELIKTFEETTLTRNNNEFIVANFESLAKSNGISINNASFDKMVPITKPTLSVFPLLQAQAVSLTFNGKLSGLQSMLKSIEKFPVPFEFSSINYNLKPETGIADSSLTINDNPDLTLSLNGVYYFWNQPTTK